MYHEDPYHQQKFQNYIYEYIKKGCLKFQNIIKIGGTWSQY